MESERFSPPRRGAAQLPILVPLLALLGFAALDRPVFTPAPHGTKPMFPVQVGLDLTDVPSGGGVARLLASITAWAPGETVEWRLELPDEVTLVDGPESWSGALGRGEARQFEIHVRVPDDRPHEIHALGRLPERPRATAGASLTIDAGASDAAPATLEAGLGQDYLQYRGEVQPRPATPAPTPEPRK